MPGLPRENIPNHTSAWALFVLYGVENMTRALRKGDGFTEAAIADLDKLCSRLKAFETALRDRQAVIEDED